MSDTEKKSKTEGELYIMFLDMVTKATTYSIDSYDDPHISAVYMNGFINGSNETMKLMADYIINLAGDEDVDHKEVLRGFLS